jgi:hypothetical protein
MAALRAADLLREGEGVKYVVRQTSCDGSMTCIEVGVITAKEAWRGRKKGGVE